MVVIFKSLLHFLNCLASSFHVLISERYQMNKAGSFTWLVLSTSKLPLFELNNKTSETLIFRELKDRFFYMYELL